MKLSLLLSIFALMIFSSCEKDYPLYCDELINARIVNLGDEYVQCGIEIGALEIETDGKFERIKWTWFHIDSLPPDLRPALNDSIDVKVNYEILDNPLMYLSPCEPKPVIIFHCIKKR